MKYIQQIGLMALAATVFSSCTKVIDVKLNDADKKYVIEGTITDQPGSARVRLTQTKKFNEDNTYPGVSGAVVTLTDNTTGAIYTLTESTPGVYTDAALAGTCEHSYSLKVVKDAETFTATSVMPAKKAFDTLYMTHENVFGETWNLANIEFDDPAGMGNCYQAKQYVNGRQSKQIFVTNDDYTDGKHMYSKLYMDPSVDDKEKVKLGDTVTIEMLCIDPAVYKYWFSLQMSATGANQSAAPGNPVTNISGGALGYFSAQTIQSRTAIAQ